MSVVNVNLDRLKSQLLTSGLQSEDPTLFQVMDQLIRAVRQLQIVVDVIDQENITDIINPVTVVPSMLSIPGMDGIDGEDGLTVVGKDGITGSNGMVGIQGIPGIGIDGQDGDEGYPILGPKGDKGDTGSAGAGALTLLHEGSGTDGSAGAVDLDTYALASQLTVKDTLFAQVEVEVDGAHTCANPQLYNVTDGVRIVYILNGTLSGGSIQSSQSWIQSREGSTILITANTFNAQGGSAGQQVAFTTAWTGAWTISLRHLGVSAGGTMKWTWRLYKIAGQ